MSYSVAKARRLDFSGRGCSAASYRQLQLIVCYLCTQLYVISLVNEIMKSCMTVQASTLIPSFSGILMDSPHWKKSRYASFTRDNRKTEEETSAEG
jgi:hypothetical protein